MILCARHTSATRAAHGYPQIEFVGEMSDSDTTEVVTSRCACKGTQETFPVFWLYIRWSPDFYAWSSLL